MTRRLSTNGHGSTYRLILDARTAFPYLDSPAKQSTQDWSQTPAASTALAILPEHEKHRVLRFYFPRDAALALASALLKHYIIVRTCGVGWDRSTVQQEKTVQNGKPYHPGGGVEFNVSHHGEAVVLIATTKPGVKVGIDLTRVDVSKDIDRLRRDGFREWVRIFDSVFSKREVESMLQAGPTGFNPDVPAMIKGLRTFYAYWGLKEAYFKMTGDALLASWLQELEFHDVKPPDAAQSPKGPWAIGDMGNATASLRGKPIDDTQLELCALDEHYIVASSITSLDPLPPFGFVDVQDDILPLTR